MAKRSNNVKIEWPNNLKVQGMLSFPIKSEDEIIQLKEWREKKSIKKPKFPDKIGGTLFINENTFTKALDYLEETYLPFVETLYKDTDGEKGVEPDVLKKLAKQVKDRNWLGEDGKPNLPIRSLSDKDRENLNGFEAVAKIRFAGPYEESLGVAAIVRDSTGAQRVASIQELVDDEVLPESWAKTDRLWWGSNGFFRTTLRMNAFDSASIGITGYAQKIYLLPHLGLPTMGNGGGDAEVLDDGDDWDE